MAIFSTKLNVLVTRVQKCFKTLTLFVLKIFKSVITIFGYTLIRVRLPEIRIRKTVLVKKKTKKHSKSKLILTLISFSRAQLNSALACSISSTHNRSNQCLEISEFEKQERKWPAPPNKSLQKRPWGGPRKPLRYFSIIRFESNVHQLIIIEYPFFVRLS